MKKFNCLYLFTNTLINNQNFFICINTHLIEVNLGVRQIPTEIFKFTTASLKHSLIKRFLFQKKKSNIEPHLISIVI